MKIIVTKSEIDKSKQTLLNEEQLRYLLQKTPADHIYERPAKGGGTWKYVTGTYVKKVLNLMFGWNWDFEIVEHKFDLDIQQAYVLGKLKVRVVRGEKEIEIVKMQFGRSEIKFKTVWDKDLGKKVSTSEPLDIGNDLKAAATDALKKCASELGVASDIYGAQEFKEINLIDNTSEDKVKAIADMLEDDNFKITPEDRMEIERILEEQETGSYDKVIRRINRSISKK